MITIKPLEEISTLEAVRAVVEINATNEGWSRYNYAVLNRATDKTILFAQKEGRFIGYAVARPSSSSEACLPFLAVAKDSQKEQAGTQLLEGLIERVQRAGFSALYFSCREKVLPFYQKFAKSRSLELHGGEKGTYLNGDRKFELVYTFPEVKQDSSSLSCASSP